MADFLDEVGSYLDDQSVGVFDADSGRDIFRNHLPAAPDNCMVILGRPGTTIDDSRDAKNLQFPRFQIIVRNKDYALASAKMQAVRAALHGNYGLILPNWRVLRMYAEQEGQPIGQDDKGRAEFSINFLAEINAEVAT